MQKKIPFVVIVGGDEMQSGQLTLKNMKSGEQEKLTIEKIIYQVMTPVGADLSSNQ
jgi:histidyl-tRNA synthetase